MIYQKMKEWLIVAGKKKVGVLALQGGVREHLKSLNQLKNVQGIKIKYPDQLPEVDALIIPGGESTTISKLLKKYNFIQAIKLLNQKQKPIWGTCAGLILLAKKVINADQKKSIPETLGFIDITVKRNSYGSQLNSFICKQSIKKISPQPIELVFIRAPIISKVGSQVKVIAKVEDEIVAAEQENIIVTSFHPELTDDIKTHQYFIEKI